MRALQPTLSAGHEVWGCRAPPSPVIRELGVPTIHSALNSVWGFISLLSRPLLAASKPRWCGLSPVSCTQLVSLDCVGLLHSNVASSPGSKGLPDRLGHSPIRRIPQGKQTPREGLCLQGSHSQSESWGLACLAGAILRPPGLALYSELLVSLGAKTAGMTSSQPQPFFGLEWAHRGQKGQLPGRREGWEGAFTGSQLPLLWKCVPASTCSGPLQLAWQRQTLTCRIPGGEFRPPASSGKYRRLRERPGNSTSSRPALGACSLVGCSVLVGYPHRFPSSQHMAWGWTPKDAPGVFAA